MLTRKLRRSWITGTIIALLYSCAGGESSSPSSSNDIPTASRDGQNSDNNPNAPRVCRGSKVLKILDNGQYAISRLTSDRNVIVNWEIKTGKKLATLNFPLKPHLVSPNGKYFLRRIDYRKYQLIGLDGVKHSIKQIINLNATYNPSPKLHFSSDSKNLIMSYRPYTQGYTHQIDIYDLAEEVVKTSLTFKNISMAKMTRDSKNLIVISRQGHQSVLKKYDIETANVVYETPLSIYERYSELYIGSQTFVIKGVKGYYFYDLLTGNLLYKKQFKYLYDIGSEGHHAVISNRWSEIIIIDLNTGDEVLTENAPKGFTLSTCQLVDSSLQLICEDSINQGKIGIWTTGQSTTSTSCF